MRCRREKPIAAVWESKQLQLAAIVAVTAIVFWRAMVEPFMLPKVTVAGLAIVAVVVTTAINSALTRRIVLPSRMTLIVSGAFVVALVVSTVASQDVVLSLIGPRGRYTGLVPYLTYVVAFLVAAAHRPSIGDLAGLAKMLSGAVVLVSFYGFLQVADADPFGWEKDDYPDVFSTFGNANFASGFAGIVVPLALAMALSAWQTSRGWASAGVVAAAAAVAFTVAAGAVQGPVAAAVGIVVLGVVLASDRRQELVAWVSAHRGTVATVASFLLTGAVIGFWATSDRLGDELAASFVERGDFWRTAWTIFKESPVVGSGLGTYGRLFPELRPEGHAINFGFLTADDPHSVPLAMLAHGGVLLVAAYLAVVIYVGRAALRGLRARTGADRLLFGGVVGGWAAYQVQSVVSIDEPPLALLHWVLAGVIVGGASTPDDERELRLPGTPMRTLGRGWNVRRHIPGSSVALAGFAVLVGLVVALLGSWPARASLAAQHAIDLDREGRLEEAVDELERATSLAPWDANYWDNKAGTLVAAGRPAEALQAIKEAARRDFGSSRYAALAAEGSAQAGDRDAAVRWFREAVARDPNNPKVLRQAGKGLVAAGLEDEGQRLRDRARQLGKGRAASEASAPD